MSPPRDHRRHEGRKRTGHVRAVQDRIGKMEQMRQANTPRVEASTPGSWEELSETMAKHAFTGNPTLSTALPLSEAHFNIEETSYLELTDDFLESMAGIFKMWVMSTVAAQSAAAGVPVSAVIATVTIRLAGPSDG